MTKFVFLILPQVHLMDVAGPDQTILEAIGYGADFQMEYCGIDVPPQTSAGLQLARQKSFSKVSFNKGDFLFLPGANVSYLQSSEFRQNKALFDWIRATYRNGVNLVSICSGSFILAQCGLLNGITCTTHFKRTKQLQSLYPKAIVNENILFTDENGIYTSAGIAAGIDLTLHIIEKLKGGYLAHKVARELVIYNRRDGQSRQNSIYFEFRNHIHSGIHSAQEHIIENISKKTGLNTLADVACMSERNFTRVFKKETGITVNQYINTIRKENILMLIKKPDLSKRQIAQKVGLTSEKQLLRILRSASQGHKPGLKY